MARQNANTASGSPANPAGKRSGSGSSPTQTSDSDRSQRVRSTCMKFMIDPLQTRSRSVRPPVLVEITPAPIDGPSGEVNVRIVDGLVVGAAADLQVHDVGGAAIDQMVRVAGAGGKAGAHARLKHYLAGIGHQRRGAFQHVDEFVL